MSVNDKKKLKEEEKKKERKLKKLLKDRSSLKKAFILSEILKRPVDFY